MCENAGPKLKILLHFAGLGAHQHRRGLRTRAVPRTARMSAIGTPQQHKSTARSRTRQVQSTFGCSASGGNAAGPYSSEPADLPSGRRKQLIAQIVSHQGALSHAEGNLGFGGESGIGRKLIDIL